MCPMFTLQAFCGEIVYFALNEFSNHSKSKEVYILQCPKKKEENVCGEILLPSIPKFALVTNRVKAKLIESMMLPASH